MPEEVHDMDGQKAIAKEIALVRKATDNLALPPEEIQRELAQLVYD
jgi:hypothetical protein